VLVWVHSFIEPGVFENNVPDDNTTPIYLKKLKTVLAFFTEHKKSEHLIFREFHGR